MSGLFGYAAQDLELRINVLEGVVASLLDVVEPGLQIMNIDPYSGWTQVSRNGRHGSGVNFKAALENLRAYETSVALANARGRA